MGASVTACGRKITTHMLETIGALVTGKKTTIIKSSVVEKDGKVSNVYHSDNDVLLLSDTDSVISDAIIRTNIGNDTIENIFNKGEHRLDIKGREFSFIKNLTSWTSDGVEAFEKPVLAIYRHRVKKKGYKIMLSNGKSVTTTDDHSIMVKRCGKLLEIKPSDINVLTDTAISISKENNGKIY